MRWIIDYNSNEIVVNESQLHARSNYIQRVTGAGVTSWHPQIVNNRSYLFCISNDVIDGTFITAHIDDVYNICSCRDICNGKFVVANTCIWKRMSDKQLLFNMMIINPNIELWFAKQELYVDQNKNFRKSNTLNNIGEFGFQTSLSERILFTNRHEGIMAAIQKSFEQVSCVILLKD